MTKLSRRHIFFGAFALSVALLNVDALRALVRLALENPTVSHVIGIPFVTAAIIYSDRDAIFRTIQPATMLGMVLILTGFAIAIGGRIQGDSTADLTVLTASVVLLWIGGFLLFYGLISLRAALFPLTFLIFMIPMPRVVVDGATQLLKNGSTEVVASLFTLTGTPFHRQGFVFSLPSFVIEIADECSGIRSSIALLLTSLLAGYRFLSTPWTKIALVLAILPIAVLKNAVRIVSLSLLATHVDPSFLTGQLHHEGGFAFFLLALGLLVPLFLLLRWWEAKPATVAAMQ